MTCITGFVGAVPAANRQRFVRHAELAASAFHDHGLVSAVECWGDDVPDGELTSFRRAVLAEPDETVIFSWYVWPSPEAQDEAMRRAAKDPRMGPEANPMPFDGQRVVWGSFEPILEVGRPLQGGYFDGFVIPVPRDARAAYGATAAFGDPIIIEHGAVWIMEAWELQVPDGKVTDFRRAVAAKPDEAIVFSWVQWPDRAARDAGNARIRADSRLATQPCPFDPARMIVGGFAPLLQTGLGPANR